MNTATSSGSQKSLPIAFHPRGNEWEQLPIGPIMKVKYFRLNIVFESSVTVLWALVYVPDGPLYEPQQFIIASGVYTSQE